MVAIAETNPFILLLPGLYLFVQVIAAFTVDAGKLKLRHYALIGWGEKSRK